MKLVLTPGFSPGFTKSLEPCEVSLMEKDHSSVVGEASQSATAIAEKVPDTIAELICSVQPMTKHPLESVNVDFVPDDEVEKKKAEFYEKLKDASSEIFANTEKHPDNFLLAADEKTADAVAKAIAGVQPMKPNAFSDALKALDEQAKPSLMKIYADVMWPPYKNTYDGTPIVSISDMELVFEDLVKATRYFIETTMGLPTKEMDVCGSTSIVALHLRNQIVRMINECVVPAVAVQTKMIPLDVSLLATAVRLKACHKATWNLPWGMFVDKLHGVVFKCDEENNSPEDVEKGKLNVEVVVPADHVQLDFVIGPEGAEPAETAPQKPGEALEAFKVECEYEGSWSNQASDNQSVPSKPLKKFVEKLVDANPELLTNPEALECDGALVDPSPAFSTAFKKLTDWATSEGKDNQPVPCDPPEPSKPLAVTKVPYTDKKGAKVSQPAPGWWVGDDFCWHPPLSKEQEVDAFDLVTALDHPSVVLDSMGVSIGGHGTIGPGGVVEDLKVDGVWPVTGVNPITNPKLEKDLIQAMSEEMKKEVDAVIVAGFQMPGAPPNTVVMTPVASPGHANKNGDVFQKVPDSIAGMSDVDVVAMQEVFSKAMKIPPHLVGKCSKAIGHPIPFSIAKCKNSK